MPERGLCQCGCDKPAPIARMTNRRYGHVKGEPVRFIRGHNNRGAGNPAWNGGRTMRGKYVAIKQPDHPRADPNGYVLGHILVVEDALGKPLRRTAEVHHVNGEGADNRNANLVACNDHAYHMLLEQRTRAFDACGHADWRSCQLCQEYDHPDHLYISPDGVQARHRECQNRYWRENYGSEAAA